MTTIAAAAERISRGRFKTLIIGGGIAGVALASLLERWGERPAIVERATTGGAAGYTSASTRSAPASCTASDCLRRSPMPPSTSENTS